MVEFLVLLLEVSAVAFCTAGSRCHSGNAKTETRPYVRAAVIHNRPMTQYRDLLHPLDVVTLTYS